MNTNNTQLNENQRVQLDGIVSKMVANKEPDSAIQFVVNDFKQKYGTPQEEKPGFIQSVAQTIANPFLKLASSGRSIVDIAKAKSNAEVDLANTKPYDYGYLGKVTPLQNPLESIGAGGQIGLMAATGGSGSVAKSFGLTGTKALAARVGENALIGAGLQASSNLTNSKPVLEGVGPATITGAVLPIAATGANKIKNVLLSKAEPTAEGVINSLIKPLAKDFAYGKNPARGILNEGIVANNINDLGNQVEAKISSVGQRIGTVGEQLDKAGIVLDLTPALKPIDEAIKVAAKSNNESLFKKLNDVKTALMHDLTVGEVDGAPAIVKGEAKNLIGATYNDAKSFLSDLATHTRFTGNPSDDKALNMATKKAYGITRELMNNSADTVSPTLGKEIRNLNERYADLLSARSAIAHRDIVLKRQNIFNMAERFSLPIAAGGAIATAVVTGDFAKAGAVLAGELATLAGAKFAGSTMAKTRVAQFLSRLAPEERQGILNSTPVLKNLYERLTGQVSPGENAPKTKPLQYAQDFVKNKTPNN